MRSGCRKLEDVPCNVSMDTFFLLDRDDIVLLNLPKDEIDNGEKNDLNKENWMCDCFVHGGNTDSFACFCRGL